MVLEDHVLKRIEIDVDRYHLRKKRRITLSCLESYIQWQKAIFFGKDCEHK
jgi:hypothetical protein